MFPLLFLLCVLPFLLNKARKSLRRTWLCAFFLPSSLFLSPECARQTRLASNRNPPASTSRVLGLKMCTAISALCLSKGCIWCHAMSRPDFTSSLPMDRHLTSWVVLCYSIKMHWTLFSFPKSTRICLCVFMSQHVREVRVNPLQEALSFHHLSLEAELGSSNLAASAFVCWAVSSISITPFSGPGFLRLQGKLKGKGKSFFSWSFIAEKKWPNLKWELMASQSVGDKEEGFLPWDLCEQGPWWKGGLR